VVACFGERLHLSEPARFVPSRAERPTISGPQAPRILCVAHSPQILSLLRDLLEEARFRVSTLPTIGSGAIAPCRSFPFESSTESKHHHAAA